MWMQAASGALVNLSAVDSIAIFETENDTWAVCAVVHERKTLLIEFKTEEEAGDVFRHIRATFKKEGLMLDLDHLASDHAREARASSSTSAVVSERKPAFFPDW